MAKFTGTDGDDSRGHRGHSPSQSESIGIDGGRLESRVSETEKRANNLDAVAKTTKAHPPIILEGREGGDSGESSDKLS